MHRSDVTRSFLALLFLMSIPFAVGCEPTKGGFGEGEVKDKSGMVHKPIAEPAEAPDFKKAFKMMPSFDKASQEIRVQLDLQKGFHAYAAGETIGKPVQLVLDASGGWELDGAVVVPAGKKKDLGDLGESVILEGSVPISAKLKNGKGVVSGKLLVQVCTDTACDRPRPHVFNVATD